MSIWKKLFGGSKTPTPPKQAQTHQVATACGASTPRTEASEIQELLVVIRHLAVDMANNDERFFVAALTKATEFASTGSNIGILAMEEAMRRRAGRNDLVFYTISELKARDFDEVNESPNILLRLAKEGALLHDPKVSQDLMSSCYAIHGIKGIHACLFNIRESCSTDQFYIFQLLFNHTGQSAKLQS